MDFQESKTLTNLQNFYETLLRSSAEYEMFSVLAERETLIEIRNVFLDISRHDRTIAEMIRRLILGTQSDTQQNLQEAEADSIALKDMSQAYSNIASEEGFKDIASRLNGVANIQVNHTNVFRSFVDDMASDTLYCKDDPVVWVCLGCGNIMSRECAPERCPVCGYPQGYYQVLRD